MKQGSDCVMAISNNVKGDPFIRLNNLPVEHDNSIIAARTILFQKNGFFFQGQNIPGSKQPVFGIKNFIYACSLGQSIRFQNHRKTKA